MGWQCVPQVLGLVHGDGMRKDGKGQAKHRANSAAIIHEAFEIADSADGHAIPIRKSASETYDRTRTVNNKYTGYQTADDVLAALEAEADKQRVEVAVTDKNTGQTVIHKRALPSTTVLGAAVIFNPPSEIAKDWTPDQYARFFRDCEECLEQIPFGKVNKKGELVGEPHYLFRRGNILASAEHWDEGEPMDPPLYTGHIHVIYKPEDVDGKYYGKLIDPLNLSCMVNRRFAGLMRERGWDIDDPDYTDWEQADKDKEYRARRKSKIRQGGKAVNNYIADKKRTDAEAALTEALDTLGQAAALKQEAALRAEIDAASVRDQARAEADALLADAAEDAGNAITWAQTEAEVDAAAAAEVSGLEAEIEAVALLAEARSEAEAAQSLRDKARWEAADAVTAKLAAEADRDAAQQEAANAEKQRMAAQMAVRLLDNMRISTQAEVEKLDQARDQALVERDAVLLEVKEAQAARDAAKTEAETAKADRDAARRETADLCRDAVERAKQEAMVTRDRIEAETREAWEGWLERKKQKVSEKLDELVRDAKAKAAQIIAEATEAAQGEYDFLLKWLSDPRQRYKNGKSFLEAAREDHMREIRRNRALPSEGRGTAQPGKAGPGRTVPGE